MMPSVSFRDFVCVVGGRYKRKPSKKHDRELVVGRVKN